MISFIAFFMCSIKVSLPLTVPTFLQYYWSLDVEGASLSHEEGQMATLPAGILQGGRTSILTVTVIADDPEIMGTVSPHILRSSTKSL